jgi:hypothetical protein
MDPYIEASHLFEDFHNKLISEIERALSERVPDRYVVRTPERSYVALIEDPEQLLIPEVVIASRRPKQLDRKRKKAVPVATGQSERGPVLMRASIKSEYREPFIEIRYGDGEHKLVTGIEILSPSNKRRSSKGWRVYYRKRQAFLSSYANFVEIDL